MEQDCLKTSEAERDGWKWKRRRAIYFFRGGFGAVEAGVAHAAEMVAG